jgi:hypothetical protein
MSDAATSNLRPVLSSALQETSFQFLSTARNVSVRSISLPSATSATLEVTTSHKSKVKLGLVEHRASTAASRTASKGLKLSGRVARHDVEETVGTDEVEMADGWGPCTRV